jgi:hypothetical protein
MIACLIMPTSLDDQLASRFHHGLAFHSASCALAMLASASIWLARFLVWFWTMTALRPGPRITFPTSGTEARRGDAGRRVVEAYERLLAQAEKHRERP